MAAAFLHHGCVALHQHGLRTDSTSQRAKMRLKASIQPLSSARHAADFVARLLELEAALPTMSCSQLAQTGTTVRETYRAALLSTETGSSGPDDTATRDLLDFFTSQLPNQSWLLTYRAAVEQHLMPQHQQQQAAVGPLAAAAAGHADVSSVITKSINTSGGNSSSSGETLPIGAHSCRPEHLAEILAAVAAMPVQVVQPLPIGFGTPRWSRPMSAADPAAWEQWLANFANVYSFLLARQLIAQQQQQGSHRGATAAVVAAAAAAAAEEGLLQLLADFTISLVCSMRWVNVNVDDDRLQTPEFRQKVLECLQQQQQQQQASSAEQSHPQATAQQQQASSAEHQHPQATPQQQKQQQEVTEQVPGRVAAVPFGLAGSLAHRVTYTCLLLLLPPPRPMLSALFAATQPSDFTLEELQRIVRGLLFVGCAPPEPWLQGLVVLVRGRVGEMGQKELLGFVEAFRFFGTQVGRAPWLRDVTALMEEFSCTA